MNTNLPITVLKGIGESKAKTFSKLGIKTIRDLIHYYPREYDKQQSIIPINNVILNQVNIVRGEVSTAVVNKRIKNLIITSTRIKDNTGEIQVIWFNQPYLKNNLKIGDKIILKGKVINKYNQIQFTSPEILKENDSRLVHNSEYIPIYSLTKNISNKIMTNIIDMGLKYTKGQLKEYLPLEIKKKYDLCDYNYAIYHIHFPEDINALETAKKRLIFDEFLFFQLGLLQIKNMTKKIENKFSYSKNEKINLLLEKLPFELTNAQKKVWEEIHKDLKGNYTMNRLVQGDVGSGKTIIAAMALLNTVENGYQGCLMAPTAVLAKQHYETLNDFLKPFNIKISLLIGSLTKKQKLEIYESIKNGETQIIIGTHALIQDSVRFYSLALVITDEQHRFGVKQRQKLAGKGNFPHILVMSATPIPRTLSLIIYGDMDISVIDELPKGRKKIETYYVTSKYRNRIYNFILEEINKGRQAYIVCPMIEEQEELELSSVISYSEELKRSLPDYINIQFLHGKMKTKEKNEIMEEFADGKINILISTTVIEVGINVPNATIMLIENAERFGLAQLHQLRGRVGRGKHQSHCILVTDSKNSWTKKRMEVLKNNNDGFVIAENDLKLRGPGDILGIKQHGLPDFKIGNIFENIDLLKEANNVAKEILNEDPNLDTEKYKYLREQIDYFYRENNNQIAL